MVQNFLPFRIAKNRKSLIAALGFQLLRKVASHLKTVAVRYLAAEKKPGSLNGPDGCSGLFINMPCDHVSHPALKIPCTSDFSV